MSQASMQCYAPNRYARQAWGVLVSCYMFVLSAALKLDKASCWLDGQRFSSAKGKGNELQKVVKDCSKLAEEQLKGLTNQTVKNALFNRPHLQTAEQAPTQPPT